MSRENKRKENSYRSILRGTSVFGGVQLFQILVNLVRGKFVAMLLGPAGMGINALYTTASTTIQKFASLGLNLAIVKEVSAQRDDEAGFRATIGVARRLITATALLGCLVCMLFAVPLSRFTFGDTEHVRQFMLLGAGVFFAIAGSGLMSMLQGLHEVKRVGKSSLVGAAAGLVLGVPLYYFFGNAGIVPAIILLSLTMFLFYWLSLRASLKEERAEGEEIGHRRFRFVWQEHKGIVRKLLMLGLLLMASDLIGSGLSYLLNAIIRHFGDVDSVGYYQAANSLTNQYTGVVFAAMAMDYLPRLSGVVESNKKMTVVVNRQLEIVSLIIAPAAALLILTAPVVIRLLLTGNFLVITPLMRWMGLGVMFKALMFPLGYISIAKGNKKVFFWLEGILGNFLTFGLSIAGFVVFGLIGLGYAMVADCVVCTGIYLWVNGSLYGFRTGVKSLRQATLCMIIVVAVFALSMMSDSVAAIAAASGVTLASIVYSLTKIKKLLEK